LKSARVRRTEPAWHPAGWTLLLALLQSETLARADGIAPAPARQTWSASSVAPEPAPEPASGHGAPSAPAPAQDLPVPRRYELAGFPIVGGNTDIGVQFGAALTFTRFYDLDFPYAWNIDLLLSGSIKGGDGGVHLVQQSHVLRLDAPDLFSGELRLDTRASYQRTIDAGYYGLGNASPAGGCGPNDTRCHEYLQEEGRVRVIGRARTPLPRFDAAFGGDLRYEYPTVYETSKLAADAATAAPGDGPRAIGVRSALLAGISAGFIADTRDSEFITRSGLYYQVGVGGTLGSAEHVAYGEASAVVAHYAPLGGPFTFASRLVASFQFGRVPFYDLAQGGIFEPQYLFGGETGVRGVPQGRYAGRLKVVSNVEVRSTPFPRFTVLGQSIRIGTTTFFDAGRVWLDYAVISPPDGDMLGVKFGVGAGLFLQWGEAAIFRVEAAYSPDASAENPSLPLGIYVSDGLMF
jgi:hypothetical protein